MPYILGVQEAKNELLQVIPFVGIFLGLSYFGGLFTANSA